MYGGDRRELATWKPRRECLFVEDGGELIRPCIMVIAGKSVIEKLYEKQELQKWNLTRLYGIQHPVFW